MKKVLGISLVSMVMVALTISLASAGTATPRVEKREARQQARIAQGIRSGELTPHEAARLETGEAHIDRVEARAKADGKVTPRERMRLNRMQNRESRKIARLKHNDRVAK